jgi:hypothetical protein
MRNKNIGKSVVIPVTFGVARGRQREPFAV